MVTGIETAGLVLASIPLIVSLAEHYRAGLRPFMILRHFQQEYRSHVVLVKTQQVLFRGSLERLLIQLVPEDEVKSLMDDAGGPGWASALLEAKFKQRLGESYDAVIGNIAEINRVMDKLKKELDTSGNLVL